MRSALIAILFQIMACAQWHLDFDEDFSSASGWTPASLTSIVAWYDAQDYATLTLSNNFVTAWADKSGRGNHVTQATVIKRRTYIAADPIANNKPSVSAPSVDGQKNLVSPSMTARQIYIVTAYDNGTTATFPNTYPTLVSGPGASQVLRCGMAAPLGNVWHDINVWASGAATNLSTSTTLTALPMPLRVLRFDGISDGTQTWFFGSNSASDGRTWNGPICEIVVTSSILSTENRIKLVTYLMTKWGL